MKHSGKMLVAVLGLLALTSGAMAGITGTPHDFSGKSWSGGQICLPCHTPHHGSTTIGYLWNHAVPSDSDFTGKATGAVLLSQSLTCLGCHDGQTAIDSFGGATGTLKMGDAGTDPNNNIGRDLEDDHPVGVDYPTSGQGTSWGTVVISSGRAKVGTGNTVSLYASTAYYSIQCKTCHDPHTNANGKFLRFSNAASAMCVTCHINKK